jgi:hypothetical protein
MTPTDPPHRRPGQPPGPPPLAASSAPPALPSPPPLITGGVPGRVSEPPPAVIVPASPGVSRSRKDRAIDPTPVVLAGLAVVTLAVVGLMLFMPGSRGPGGEASNRPGTPIPTIDEVATAAADIAPASTSAHAPPTATPTYGGTPAPTVPTQRGELSQPPRVGAGPGFAALVERLEAASHQPLVSLNAANPLFQEAALCEVGNLAITVAFPQEPLPEPAAAIITCLPAGQGRWRLELTAAGGVRCDVGGLAVRGGQLVASLPPASLDNQAGRAAVAGALVRIADEADPRHHTHVQLRRAAVQRPLEFPRLAFDPRMAISDPSDDQPAKAPRLFLAAPPTPWPCRATLDGKCGQAEATVTVEAEGTPFAGLSGTPTRLTAIWVSPEAPQEPFLKTDFVIEPVPVTRTAAGFRLTAAELPAVWLSHRRFGSLRRPEGGAAPLLPGGVPPAGLLPATARFVADCGWLLADDGSPVSSEQMTTFAHSLVRTRGEEVPAVVTAKIVFQAPRFAGRRQPLAQWLTELREELEQSRGETAIALRMLVDELVVTSAGKRLAAEVLAGLGPGTAVFTGRIETVFPSLDAAAVILTIGAATDSPPRP